MHVAVIDTPREEEHKPAPPRIDRLPLALIMV